MAAAEGAAVLEQDLAAQAEAEVGVLRRNRADVARAICAGNSVLSDSGRISPALAEERSVPIASPFTSDDAAKSDKEGTGERVAKVIAFGVFAGSGKSYEASVTLTNADGLLLWAHNSKKSDIRRAAEDVAERLEEHIKKQARR